MRDDLRDREGIPARVGWSEPFEDEAPAIQRWLRGWWRLTAPEDPGNGASLAAREHARVGRLTSAILLAVIVLSTASLPTTFGTPALTIGGSFALGLSVCALLANRRGMVTTAALLVIFSTDLGLMFGVWFLPDQKLGLMWLFVATVVMSASLLPPLMASPFVLAQCLFVLLDFMLQPNTPQYVAIRANGEYVILAAPILGQVFIAFVTFLWANSTSHALRRADRAEELAELQERESRRIFEEAERRHELEEGLTQMQAVLSQLANGNFHARVRPLRDAQLWQLGNTLNHFIGRLARMGQSEFTLKRTDDESRRLADAIFVMRSGRQPIWPGVSGTPLDRVIEALTVEMSRSVSEVMNESATTPNSDARPDERQAPMRGAASSPIIVTGTLLPVTGALIHDASATRRQTGSLTLGADTPATTPPWLRDQAGATPRANVKITPVEPKPSPRPAPDTQATRQRPSVETARRKPSTNDQLALPAPDPAVELPSWLMGPRVAPRSAPDPRANPARSDHAARPAPHPDHLNGPAMGGLPSLRTAEMFTPPWQGSSHPTHPPRRPGSSLPRVRLESGALSDERDRTPFPPGPASPTKH